MGVQKSMVTMKSSAFNAKRYCLILPLACLGLVVLYHLYWVGDWASEDVFGLRKFTPPVEMNNDTELATAPVPTLPSEYLATSQSQQECDLFFTTSYLEHIAKHQQPYCDAQSLSSFHCFTAPRFVVPMTAGWGETDPLCVAQGVAFHPATQIGGDDQAQTSRSYSRVLANLSQSGSTND